MSAPRNDWQPQPPPPPPYGAPPGPPPGQPPPYAGPPAGPPPAPGVPPPAPPRDRGGLVAGIVVIAIGVFFLLGQFVPDIGRWIPVFIGLIFLVAFVAKREYGFLIPGCIVGGVGVGIVLAGILDDPWSGAAVLFSIGGGFLLIWLVSVLMHRLDPAWPKGESHDAARALWWPLIPGGILVALGFVVLADEGVDGDLLRWWPVVLIVIGAIILISALTRRDGRRG